jgi:membrane protease subunit (stomatin/prohibitin family)
MLNLRFENTILSLYLIIFQVSSITNVQTSEGQLIAMNVEDAHVIDPSQLHALSVIAEAAKGSQIQIPDIIAAAAASGVSITTSDDGHIVAVQNDNGQQAHVEVPQQMQEGAVTNDQEEQPMETA